MAAVYNDNSCTYFTVSCNKKGYEPYLLLPISFGMLLVNLPGVPKEGMMEPGGLLYYLYQGVKLGIYPPLIFLAIGATAKIGRASCRERV